MEDYEIAHIEENLWELIQSTFCNVQLLARLQQANILLQVDVEDIQRVHLTPLERSRRFYEILPTREGAYSVLIEALEEVRQTAAVKILRKVDPTRQVSRSSGGIVNGGKEAAFRKGVDRQQFLQQLIVRLNLSAEFGRDLLSYINSVDSKGHNILFKATHQGLPVDILKTLVEYGANWNAETNSDETVIHAAAVAGNPEAIKYFAKLGVSVHKVSSRHETALHYAAAAKQNRLETVQALIDCGADINAGKERSHTPLDEFANKERSTAEIGFLIKLGAESMSHKPEFTSLHSAAGDGNYELVRYFLTLGIPANVTTEAGETPLHVLARCCRKNFRECLLALIEHGADINAVNKFGATPVYVALDHNDRRTAADIKLMVESGADVKRGIKGHRAIDIVSPWDDETTAYMKTLGARSWERNDCLNRRAAKITSAIILAILVGVGIGLKVANVI